MVRLWELFFRSVPAGCGDTDNFIRPIVLGEQIKIHPLLLFFSITGGLAVFGFNGLILGPIILILFIAAGDLYRALNEESEFSNKKSESES